MFSKKILSIAILFCYVVSQVLSYLGYIQRGSVYASGESKNTYSNLVAVLVDERVYPKIENELKIPYSIEAEEALLGSIFIKPDAISEVKH